MTDEVLARADGFMWSRARLLERRAYEHAFHDGDGDAVVQSVRAFRNPDGGFGHALEPDLRTPASQPIFVHYGLSLLQLADVNDRRLVRGTCEFLALVAHESGAVPYALPDARNYDRAGHWNGEFAFAPSLHATAGVTGVLHALGAVHEWLDRATDWCLQQIEGKPKYSGHTLLNALELLRFLPDRDRADQLWEHATERLFESDHVALELPLKGYGLTPLHFAPTPEAPARSEGASIRSP